MKSKILKWTSLLAVLFFGSMLAVSAQTAADSPSEEEGEDTNIIDLIKQGGVFMIPLGLLSVAGTGLVVFNFFSIRPQAFLSEKKVEELSVLIESLDIEGAKAFCEENNTPVINIIGAGLDRIQDGEIDHALIEKAVDDASTEELSGAFLFVNYLSVIGAVSPMVGLLGTVSGMVKAFRAIGTVGMGNPSVLAENISEALITTAGGLIVAVPALLFYFYFKSRYGKITSSVNRIVGDVFFKLSLAVRRATA